MEIVSELIYTINNTDIVISIVLCIVLCIVMVVIVIDLITYFIDKIFPKK